jgi:ribosomal protein S12 methylthiotransferase
VRVGPHAAAPPDDRERLRLTPRHYAYLRISEGCDNRCAYCAIPEIRGPLRSKLPQEVLAEAEELAADGAREIILIGQDTTAYGRDAAREVAAPAWPNVEDPPWRVEDPPWRTDLKRRDGWSLGRLLAEMRTRIRVPWIRLMYTHPASFGEDVVEQLAAGPPVAPYVDLPLQHINDEILASMGRRVGRAAIEALIDRLRRAVPGIAIRTSFIVGYPGETDERFRELAAFVEKVRFDHVGVFVYSPEPGTRAAGLPGHVPQAVARRRWNRLMRTARHLAHAAARAREGQTLAVLVDGPDDSGRLVARHAGQAPEVDSAVLLRPGSAEVGSIVRVRITGAEGYDLVGEVKFSL